MPAWALGKSTRPPAADIVLDLRRVAIDSWRWFINLQFNVAAAQFVLPGVVQNGQLGDPAGFGSEGWFGTTARYSRIIARRGKQRAKFRELKERATKS